MKAAKKAVKKPTTKPTVKREAENLFAVKLRGFKDDPRLRIIVDAATEAEAREKAKAVAVDSELSAKPAVSSSEHLPGQYRVYGGDRTMYMLVRDVIVRKGIRGALGSRDDESYKNDVGYVSMEFHASDLKGPHYSEPQFGKVFLSIDKKGLYSDYVDEDAYVEPHKSFLACIFRIYWDEICAVMKAEATKHGIRL